MQKQHLLATFTYGKRNSEVAVWQRFYSGYGQVCFTEDHAKAALSNYPKY
jgi:hypothetical protein